MKVMINLKKFRRSTISFTLLQKKGQVLIGQKKIELNIMPFQKIKVLKVKKLNIKIFLVSGLLTWHQ